MVTITHLADGFSCSTDAGCISIRLVESLDGQPLPVVFSLFQDIFPVFCVDISPRMRVGSGGQPSTNHYLATVEWSGTFNNVHDGLLNVYKGFQVNCTTHADVEQKRKRMPALLTKRHLRIAANAFRFAVSALSQRILGIRIHFYMLQICVRGPTHYRRSRQKGVYSRV